MPHFELCFWKNYDMKCWVYISFTIYYIYYIIFINVHFSPKNPIYLYKCPFFTKKISHFLVFPWVLRLFAAPFNLWQPAMKSSSDTWDSPQAMASTMVRLVVYPHYLGDLPWTTVDGWNLAPVEVGSLSHYLEGFSTIPGGAGFQLSTVSLPWELLLIRNPAETQRLLIWSISHYDWDVLLVLSKWIITITPI